MWARGPCAVSWLWWWIHKPTCDKNALNQLCNENQKNGKLNKVGELHQCWYPGCDIVLRFCKMLPLREAALKGARDLSIISYNCTWIYSYHKIKGLFSKKEQELQKAGHDKEIATIRVMRAQRSYWGRVRKEAGKRVKSSLGKALYTILNGIIHPEWNNLDLVLLKAVESFWGLLIGEWCSQTYILEWSLWF